MTATALLVVPPESDITPTFLAPERHPLAFYLAGLAPSSRATVLRALRPVAALAGGAVETVHWHELRAVHLAAIREQLIARDLAPATVNLALSALRGVARAAWELGLMSAEEYARVGAVKRARGERLPAGRAASGGEVRALMEACAADPTPAGARDAALVALLYAAGLRRTEAAGLAAGDIDLDAGSVAVRCGKGNKGRLVYLAAGAAAATRDWLDVRGPAPGPLFLAINKGGRIGAGGMGAQAVYNALAKRARQAGVAHLSPHDLRRTFVGDLLDAGADIATVQKLAGHASVATTARYDRRGEAAKRRAVALLHVPYRARGA